MSNHHLNKYNQHNNPDYNVSTAATDNYAHIMCTNIRQLCCAALLPSNSLTRKNIKVVVLYTLTFSREVEGGQL